MLFCYKYSPNLNWNADKKTDTTNDWIYPLKSWSQKDRGDHTTNYTKESSNAHNYTKHKCDAIQSDG